MPIGANMPSDEETVEELSDMMTKSLSEKLELDADIANMPLPHLPQRDAEITKVALQKFRDDMNNFSGTVEPATVFDRLAAAKDGEPVRVTADELRQAGAIQPTKPRPYVLGRNLAQFRRWCETENINPIAATFIEDCYDILGCRIGSNLVKLEGWQSNPAYADKKFQQSIICSVSEEFLPVRELPPVVEDGRKIDDKITDLIPPSSPLVMLTKDGVKVFGTDVSNGTDPFLSRKHFAFKGGPADGLTEALSQMPPDGLISFFAEVSPGNTEQAVYQLLRKAKEQTSEEINEHKPLEYEWVAEYKGKRRYLPVGIVNGIRKGS